MMIWTHGLLVGWHHSGEAALMIYAGGLWILGGAEGGLSLVKEFDSYQYEGYR